MSFFSAKRKGTDAPQTLTEKEIQQRLYGHFRSGRGSYLTTLPSKVEEKSVNSVVVDDHAQVEFKKDLFSPANSSTSSLNKNASKENIDSAAALKWTKAKIPVNTESKMTSDLGFVHAQERVEAPTKKLDAKDHWLLLWYLKWKPSVQAGINSLGDGLGKMGLALLTVPKIIAVFLYDRRKWFIKSFNWIVAIAVIIGLFSAVNYLNVKREKAMKESSMHPKSNKTVTARKEQNRPQPMEATTNAQAQNDDMGQSQNSSNEPVAAATSKTTSSVEPSVKQGTGRFVIQIATYADENDARKVLNRLKENQIPTFIKGFERVGGKVYYSVFIGRFESHADAENAYNDFKKSDLAQLFRDAFIRILKE
ncbi:MAG: SPOR domain-containing protein [Candidatus Omnitrophica bacterium]|nr:SPOR domain-containing protein [Candidatus Omnitrophota bacterium]